MRLASTHRKHRAGGVGAKVEHVVDGVGVAVVHVLHHVRRTSKLRGRPHEHLDEEGWHREAEREAVLRDVHRRVEDGHHDALDVVDNGVWLGLRLGLLGTFDQRGERERHNRSEEGHLSVRIGARSTLEGTEWTNSSFGNEIRDEKI